jgi:hypothetical protein
MCENPPVSPPPAVTDSFLPPHSEPAKSVEELLFLLLNYRFREKELVRIGVCERDFKRMVSKLRLLLLDEGYVLED